MENIDVSEREETPIDSDLSELVGVDVIVFLQSDLESKKYVHDDGNVFNPIDERMMSQSEKDIQKRLASPDTAPKDLCNPEEREKRHKQWHVAYIKNIIKPQPPPRPVAYMYLEDDRLKGSILSWIYIKDLRCVAIKREFGM
ncbi:hypothetical protein Hanom_Chr16g01482911 [Helianthus anomalus]